MALQGEGLIISHATPGMIPPTAGGAGVSLPSKWKCPSEPQFGNIEALKQLEERLVLSEGWVGPFLPRGLPRLLKRLMGVATGTVNPNPNAL